MTDRLKLSRDVLGDILLEADDRLCVRLTDAELEWLLVVGPLLLKPGLPAPVEELDE